MSISQATARTTSRLRISAFALLAAVPELAMAQAVPAPGSAQPAQPAQPDQAAAAAPAPSPLAQIPGVTVQYYDVTGVTIPEIQASIEAQRPRDAATGVPIPTSANWSIRTNVRRATTGTQCRVVGATATFVAQVVMPRLVNVEAVPPAVLGNWNAYVVSIEQQQAERLRQPFERLREVEAAVMASSCEGANAAADRAIAQITAAPPPPPPPTPAQNPPAPAQ